jgi:hypothetical protein
MATYIENEIFVTNDSVIEYTSQHGKVSVGPSTKRGHEGTFTFLDANGKDTLYGNGCRYRHKKDAISHIKNHIKSCIINNEPVQKLFVDGVGKQAFIKILEETIF